MRVSLQVSLRVLLQLAFVIGVLATHSAHPGSLLLHDHLADPPVQLCVDLSLLRVLGLPLSHQKPSLCVQETLLHSQLNPLLFTQGVDVIVLVDNKVPFIRIVQQIKVRQLDLLLLLQRLGLDHVGKVLHCALTDIGVGRWGHEGVPRHGQGLGEGLLGSEDGSDAGQATDTQLSGETEERGKALLGHLKHS